MKSHRTPPPPPPGLHAFCSPNKTSTAQAILKYDEDGGEAGEEEGSGDHLNAGDDGRDPLDADLVHLRKSIRSHVRHNP